MKKIWSLSVLLLWLTTSLAVAQECSRLIVTGPPAAAPASWVDEKGKLTGAAVEFVVSLARTAGFKDIELRTFPTWSLSLQAAYRGEVDIIFSTNWSEERDRYLDYVRPAMSGQFLNVVVRRGEAFTLNSLDGLLGRTGANSEGETYGDGYFGDFVRKQLTLTKAPSIEKVFDLLLEKKVDYILGFENAVYEQIMVRNLGTQLQSLNTFPTRVEGFIAFSKRSKCSEAVRDKFADQVAVPASSQHYRLLMIKYREIFNEGLTRPTK